MPRKSFGETLSPREKQVLEGLAEGLCLKEVAAKLGISRCTACQAPTRYGSTSQKACRCFEPTLVCLNAPSPTC